MKYFELRPNDGHKSFYGKAIVKNGTLFSYGTPIMSINGVTVRHWDDWTKTTGRHIQAFSGLNKKDFYRLQYEQFNP